MRFFDGFYHHHRWTHRHPNSPWDFKTCIWRLHKLVRHITHYLFTSKWDAQALCVKQKLCSRDPTWSTKEHEKKEVKNSGYYVKNSNYPQLSPPVNIPCTVASPGTHNSPGVESVLTTPGLLIIPAFRLETFMYQNARISLYQDWMAPFLMTEGV